MERVRKEGEGIEWNRKRDITERRKVRGSSARETESSRAKIKRRRFFEPSRRYLTDSEPEERARGKQLRERGRGSERAPPVHGRARIPHGNSEEITHGPSHLPTCLLHLPVTLFSARISCLLYGTLKCTCNYLAAHFTVQVFVDRGSRRFMN